MAKKKPPKVNGHAKKARGKKVWPGPSARAQAQLAAKKTKAKQPRARPLPGMEDARIQQLEDVGASYADIRDQRIALNQEEHSLKETALALMHRYGKTIYRTDSLEIVVSPGDEIIKVKLKKPAEVKAQDVEDARGEASSDEMAASDA